MRVLVLILISLSLSGCVGTAHREISGGDIKPGGGWDVSSGGGRSSSYYATVFEKEEIRLQIIPCNYEPGYGALLLPVPIPLGSQPGIEKGPQFIISGAIYTDGELTFMPYSAFLKIGGKEYKPTKAENFSMTCDSKEMYKYFPSIKRSKKVPREWQPVESDLTFTSDRYMYFSLWFNMQTPSVNEEFSFYLGSVIVKGKGIEMPIMEFSKGSSWGGW